MLFIVESIIATGATVAYFIYSGKKRIGVIESYTRNYSITLAEAFAEVAGFSYRAGSYRDLKILFREKIQANTIDEAFFVLRDGSLIVHSSREIEKILRGNIANDEFAYNIDLILRPVFKKSRKIQFTHYNIMGKIVPFTRDERRLLKKYMYSDINTLGWLISRAVFVRGKPVGTVNFIISKDRIFDFLLAHIEESMRFLIYALCGAFVLSLVVSMVVLMRYRSIQEKTRQSLMDVKPAEKEYVGEWPAETEIPEEDSVYTVAEIISKGEDEYITIELLSEMEDEKPGMSPGEGYLEAGKLHSLNGTERGTGTAAGHLPPESGLLPDREVKDAIPVTRNGVH